MAEAPPLFGRPRYGKFVIGVTKERVPRTLRRSLLSAATRLAARDVKDGPLECPVCGASFDRFLGDRCAYCMSTSRERMIALFLRREVGIDTGHRRVLHFAPEPGLSDMLATLPSVGYVPADLNPARGHQRVDATQIELEPYFDGLIASHVIEHIVEERRAMGEMLRVLRPGGWALIVVPLAFELPTTLEDDSVTGPWSRHRHFGQHDHMRVYGLDFADRLAGFGFQVSERRYASELGPGESARFKLEGYDVIFFCVKP